MADSPRIAIDAMGGDVGPGVTVAGAAIALKRDPRLSFTLFGSEPAIRAELARRPALGPRVTLVGVDGVVSADDKPSQAMRRSRSTSMGLAVQAVKAGEAHAAVSGGNTGALMAIAKLALRTMAGIDRPALAALMPTLGEHDLVMLDLGANTECDAQNLVQFAVMGAAYSRTVIGLPRPRVKLLNIGTEEGKGTEELREAAASMRERRHPNLQFDGFIEADRLGRGDADVIVSDGFSGNIALKSVEGTARFVTDLIRSAFASSLRSKAGFLLSRPALHLLRTHLDPNNHNGAVFLGLNGVVVKSHGGATADGVANAIGVAAKLVDGDIVRRIQRDLVRFEAHEPEAAAAQ